MKIEQQEDQVVVTLTREEVNAIVQEYDEVTLELEANHEDGCAPTLDQLIAGLQV